MGGLLAQIAIYGLAAALAAPIAAVVTALILSKSKRPLVSVWTFVAGAAFLDVVFAAVILAADLFEDGGDVPALIYAVNPTRAVPLVARMTEWIMANSRLLELAVGLGFGGYFLAKGLAVLA